MNILIIALLIMAGIAIVIVIVAVALIVLVVWEPFGHSGSSFLDRHNQRTEDLICALERDEYVHQLYDSMSPALSMHSFVLIIGIVLDTKGWRDVAEATRLEPSTEFRDLDYDSADFVELIMTLEEEFGGKISDAEAQSFRTFEDVVRYIDEHYIETPYEEERRAVAE